MIILRKLAKQQKEQRALKIKNIKLKQTHDVKLAESRSPNTEKLDTIKESTKQLGELVKKLDVEDGNTQTLAIEITSTSQSLRDILSFIKKGKFFLKLEQTDRDKVFCNKVPNKPLRDNKNSIKVEHFDKKTEYSSVFY